MQEDFKFWLLDKEFSRLWESLSISQITEALDMINAMEASTDQEFNRLTGVPYKWTRMIAGSLGNYLKGSKMNNSAYYEDILTDIIRVMISALTKGNTGVTQEINFARNTYKDPEELQENMVRIMMKWTKFWVQEHVRIFRRKQSHSVGTIDDFENQASSKYTQDASDNNVVSYTSMISDELKSMQDSATRNRNSQLATRLQKAIEVLPDRIMGYSFGEIKEKHGIKSKATLYAILQDIYQALARVGAKIGDPTIMNGVKNQNISVAGG